LLLAWVANTSPEKKTQNTIQATANTAAKEPITRVFVIVAAPHPIATKANPYTRPCRSSRL
jgi:hypothetical protein